LGSPPPWISAAVVHQLPKRSIELSATTLEIAEQVQSDFDSSSPGGTQSGFGGLAVLGLFGAFIVFSIAIVIRRSRGQPLPPAETSHQHP
jgi:hypothetical protein